MRIKSRHYVTPEMQLLSYGPLDVLMTSMESGISGNVLGTEGDYDASSWF